MRYYFGLSRRKDKPICNDNHDVDRHKPRMAMSDLSDSALLLKELIAFPSVSRQSNLDIVAFIEDFLRKHQISSRRVPDATGRKASLLATIGPGNVPGLLLSAHTDVVPVDGQDWKTPPFTATVVDGRIFGRGSTDMKGFIACILANVADLKRSATNAPVHLAFSYDEELGCLGAPDLARAVAQFECLPALCLVGEPTRMKLVHAHKGKMSFRVTVRGRGGHSASPHRALNALYTAASIVSNLADLANQMEREGERDETFDPPWTTVHVGSLHGGSALNLVPEEATLEFEIRFIPGGNPNATLRRLSRWIEEYRSDIQQRAPEADVRLETIAAYPALERNSSQDYITLMQHLSGTVEGAGTVSYGTEAGIYAAAGIPSIVCGPGDMSRAHKADEWIGCDELAAGDRMMQRIARVLSDSHDGWLASSSSYRPAIAASPQPIYGQDETEICKPCDDRPLSTHFVIHR
jgi:acetylornithine deacetylase